MTWLFAFGLVKWAGVLGFAVGLAGAFLATEAEQRRVAAQWVATPAFVLVWLGGYGMLESTGVSLGSAWVSASFLAMIGALHLALSAAPRTVGRLPRGGVALALVLTIVGLMLARPGTRLEAHTASPLEVR